MSSGKTSGILRRGAILILSAAVGYGLWSGVVSEAEAMEAAEERLTQTLENYRALRLKDDWVSIYDMVDPVHREEVSVQTFLKFFGSGILLVKDIETRSREIDWEATVPTAKVALSAELEMVPSKLPAQFRRGLRIDDPEALLQTTDFEMDWVWRENGWYFQLDSQVLAQKDSEGNALTPIK